MTNAIAMSANAKIALQRNSLNRRMKGLGIVFMPQEIGVQLRIGMRLIIKEDDRWHRLLSHIPGMS